MQKFFNSNFEVGKPSILFPWEISYRSANMLSWRPYGRRGARTLSDANPNARAFLKNFDALQKHSKKGRNNEDGL
jgi:hypothetical protein